MDVWTQTSQCLKGMLFQTGCTSSAVVLTPSPCESVGCLDFGDGGLLGGTRGEDSAYGMLESFDGTGWYEDLGCHLPFPTYGSDDPVPEEGEAFCYMGHLRLFL